MLSSVSGDDQKDRTDREVVTPWLKFLWETYRTALEILRNNNKLEVLYQETCQQAFNFCLKYKRHTEFRRLSEMLRTHLANIGRNVNQAQSINLSSPGMYFVLREMCVLNWSLETLQLHLDARFAQLNAAVELELWQEAFRSIEDIHGLITLAKNKPKPQVLANYYQKLAQIFWVSENYLFHAFAYSKYVSITKAFQKPSADELKMYCLRSFIGKY
jgi:translation initiation factor 3 subunit A